MRDKPEDDRHVEIPEQEQAPEPKKQERPEQENVPTDKPADESLTEETGAEPDELKIPAGDPDNPRIPEEPAFRIKDQFRDLDTIQPSKSGTSRMTGISKGQVPGAGLPAAAQPGRSIRRDNSLQDFFRNLDIIKIVRGSYRKLWVVLATAFITFLLFLPIGKSLKGNASYSAESVIIYTKPTQKQIDAQGSSFLLRPLSADTLVDMFLSPINIKELEEKVGLRPLDKNVSFDSQTKSDIVTLRVNGMPDEDTAIHTVNTLADIIIENNDEYYRELASSAYETFKNQRQAIEEKYREATQAVEDFQLKHQLLELNTQYENHFAAVNAAQERLSIAKVAYEGILVRIKSHEETIAGLPDEILNESLEDNPLKRRISNAEAALLQARIQYAADNPKIQRQERELEELRKMLQSGSFNETRERTYIKNPLKAEMEGELIKLRSEEKVARQQVEALKKDVERLQAQFQELPRLEKEYGALLEARAEADAALKSIRANEEATRLTVASNLSDFKILSRASTAEATAGSLIGKVVPIAGFILGFFGGLAIVLLIELLDAKIRTQQQLEKAYDAPCLASIVEIPNLTDYDTYGLLLPSLREISDRLNVVLRGQQSKVFGFFSSQDSEGKSTLSFNLARYYSSLNLNILFVSFDFRRNPCLPDAADVGWPQMGIEDYLRNNGELEDMLTEVHGVNVIRVQEPHSNLLELAKSSAMPRMWDLLRQNYDLIITEVPAILDHPISGTIAGFMDEIIYVLASPVSDRRLVDAGLEFLEDRGLAPRALIFNRVDPYYLEDIRQQRVIRNLTEDSNPIIDFINRFRKPAAEPSEETAEDLYGVRMNEAEDEISFDDEELDDLPDLIGDEIDELDDDEIPELIGEEEEPEEEPVKPSGEPTNPESDDVSFRDWFKHTPKDNGEEPDHGKK